MVIHVFGLDGHMQLPSSISDLHFYCHQCQCNIDHIPTSRVCPHCGEGFIEDISHVRVRLARLETLFSSLIQETDRQPRPARPDVLSTLRSVELDDNM